MTQAAKNGKMAMTMRLSKIWSKQVKNNIEHELNLQTILRLLDNNKVS